MTEHMEHADCGELLRKKKRFGRFVLFFSEISDSVENSKADLEQSLIGL